MKGKRIVVDADVGRSAASAQRAERGEVPEPASVSVLRALQAMRQARHRLVWSPALQEEWNRNVWRGTSGYAWLAEMFARKLVDRPNDDGDVERIARLAERRLEGREVSVVVKDAHVVAAALAHGDRRVLSRDRTAREMFGRLADDDREIGGVLWADPAEVGTRGWLLEGAPDVVERRLRGVERGE